jgi:hypothetical protein
VNVNKLNSVPEFAVADSKGFREDDLSDGSAFFSGDFEDDALGVGVLEFF